MTPGEAWLAATWPFVREQLPDPPAAVIDLGCGRVGGFVPKLRAEGYDAIGVDPNAPDGPEYRRAEFEHAEVPGTVDALVASTSLHHVGDPARALDRVVQVVRPGGVVIVLEWASELFDEPTARWCSERLGSEESWLHELCDDPRGWLEHEGLHRGDALVQLLDERLEPRLLARGPYFFPDLAETSEAEEQAAIDAGQIQPGRIAYAGTRPRSAHA
jgi:SAM-dependent methyltransferase